MVLFGAVAAAQPQLDNPSFETWTNIGQASEEPANWSSLKTSDGGVIINSLVPQLCWRSTDAHTGSYSVNLRTVSSSAGTANGLLTNGRVHAELNISNSYVFTDQTDSQWNTPLTSRPDSLIGWFKAVPVSGDRPNIGALLHVNDGRLPAFGTEGNWVAGVSWKGPMAPVGSWTRFAKEVNYINGTTPQWILFILTAGDSAGSQVGTQVWYDDLALIYNVHCAMQDTVIQVNGVSPTDLTVDYSTGGTPTGPTTFSVELSDANGDFTSPLTIGSVTSSSTTGSIPCSIPGGTTPSANYRIRVVGASPFYAPVGCGIHIEMQTGVVEPSLRLASIRSNANTILITMMNAAGDFDLYDAQGRALASGRLSRGLNTIDQSAHHGTVFVRIRSEEGSIAQRVYLP
ncbi:MAG TPA: hypothetical protein PK760_10425 [Flavobacteriales bacterium]|nr:hypothetical protein [Flavobacteriales bacterium]